MKIQLRISKFSICHCSARAIRSGRVFSLASLLNQLHPRSRPTTINLLQQLLSQRKALKTYVWQHTNSARGVKSGLSGRLEILSSIGCLGCFPSKMSSSPYTTSSVGHDNCKTVEVSFPAARACLTPPRRDLPTRPAPAPMVHR